MEENKNDGEPKKEAEEDIYKKITIDSCINRYKD